MRRLKASRTIPFGWKQCEDDADYIESIDKEQEVLAKAREYRMNGVGSLRDICEWIAENTGRKLSPRGLQIVLAREY